MRILELGTVIRVRLRDDPEQGHQTTACVGHTCPPLVLSKKMIPEHGHAHHLHIVCGGLGSTMAALTGKEIFTAWPLTGTVW